MSHEAPSSQEQSFDRQELDARFAVENKIFEAGDIVNERLPDAPEKAMLQSVLSAAGRIVGPVYRDTPWPARARMLRTDLENALSELRRLEEAE